jgi:hypothetical protein
MSTKMELLENLYNDPKTGFVGKRKLYLQAKAINPLITMRDVGDFFAQSPVEQIHKKPKAQGKQHRHIVGPINSIQADLIFYPYPRQNKGFNVILTAIGINNRIGYAIPMKGKKASEAARAMKELIEQCNASGHPFHLIETDQGSEFINKIVQKVLLEHDIEHIMGQEGDHNFMGKIERFNRTLKGMISKYMTANDTTKWIDVLDEFVENYNNSINSAIALKPIKVSERREQRIIDKDLEENRKHAEHLVNVGDVVRLPVKKGTFDKEGQYFSTEVYTVDEIGPSKLSVRNKKGNLLKKKYRISEVLVIPKGSKPIVQEKIKKAKKVAKVARKLQQEGIEPVQMQPRQKRNAALTADIINKTLAWE